MCSPSNIRTSHSTRPDSPDSERHAQLFERDAAYETAMTLAHDDPYNLARFVDAQANDYSRALAELRTGKKLTHWIWYVLPQLRGLGSSSRANYYGIGSLAEAGAYLSHPILGQRLRECVAAINSLTGVSAVEVLGRTDAAKFQSCLSLFRVVDPTSSGFGEALAKYFAGIPDERSLALLNLVQHEAYSSAEPRINGHEDNCPPSDG